jgi:hypothetical protein
MMRERREITIKFNLWTILLIMAIIYWLVK